MRGLEFHDFAGRAGAFFPSTSLISPSHSSRTPVRAHAVVCTRCYAISGIPPFSLATLEWHKL